MRRWIAKNLIQLGRWTCPIYFEELVKECSVKLARLAVKEILKDSRLLHCAFCFGVNQLKKFGDKYLCKICFNEVTEKLKSHNGELSAVKK